MVLEPLDVGAREPDAPFHAAPIGIGRVDANGRLAELNPEFARLLGVLTQPALHRTLDEIAPSTDDRWRNIVAAARDTPGLSRRMVTVGAPSDPRSLEVLAWSSAPGGSRSFVTLLVSQLPADRSSAWMTGAVERARFAREIHDGLAQDLWLAKLTASKLERHPTLDKDARALCVELLRSIDAGLSEARTAVLAMRSTDEPTITLSELISRQVNEFSDRFGIRIESHVGEGQAIPARVSVEMLRILQEALNNVRKHAAARHVVVRVERRRASIDLSVRDDGVGFDPTVKTGGYGQQSMHERAQSIGARLTIASVPGQGTTMILRVPVSQLVSQR